MNRYLKLFLHRGLIFGGFGPLVLGIIFVIIERGGTNLALSAGDVLLGIASTYLIAFVQAGASVFNQIEHWPLTKSVLVHFCAIFAVYSLAYVANAWIPFEPLVLLIFSLVFVLVYFSIWLTVYFCTKAHTKRLNASLDSAREDAVRHT
jgi:hypothetical protein